MVKITIFEPSKLPNLISRAWKQRTYKNIYSVEIWGFFIQILREINFGHFEYFSRSVKFSQWSKFKASKIVIIAIFNLQKSAKLIHINFEWQKNLLISTLCIVDHTKYLLVFNTVRFVHEIKFWQITMLQKLEKCEVKAYNVEIQEFNWNQFWQNLNIKNSLFSMLEALNFEFWSIWDLENGSDLLKSKFRTSIISKKWHFWPFQFTKIWFQVKSDLQ